MKDLIEIVGKFNKEKSCDFVMEPSSELFNVLGAVNIMEANDEEAAYIATMLKKPTALL